jgi:molecular chaperone DnaK
MGTGREQKITITASSGLSKEEIDKMMRDAESHAADDVKKREEIESRNRLDGLVYQMEKTLNENREKVGAVAGDVETAIADAKKALAEGGAEKMNEAFNQLQTASHKLAEALYQQTATSGTDSTTAEDQASAAGASTAGGSGEDNVIDAEYVDVDENK